MGKKTGLRSQKTSPQVELARLQRSCVQAARAAGNVLMRHYGRKLKLTPKPSAGLVTNADIAAERAVLRILRKAHPDMGFFTEESEQTRSDQLYSSSGNRFIVDPLDGTTNFIHGFPMFCVSIAAEIQGQIAVGVIYHPVLNELYTAIRGQGAKLNGKKLKVSSTPRLYDSLLTTGFTYRKENWLHAEMQAFEKLSQVARAVRRPGSAALDLAYTARGVFDGFWERNLSLWDVAAGALLVQEAGGSVTYFDGKPWDGLKKEIVATNGKIHDALSQTLAPQFCELPAGKPV